MADCIHLVKLCVGADGVEDLARWQRSAAARGPDGHPVHVTRMWPKREAELLAGGSLYWVFRGVILARQRVLRLDPVQRAEGPTRCALVLDPQIIRTEPAPRRPFQGWRYLAPDEAPRDLAGAEGGTTAKGRAAPPPALLAALAELGVR